MGASSALSSVFRAGLGAKAGERPASATLEATLEACHASAVAAWPGLPLPAEVFMRRLAECGVDDPDPEKGLGALCTDDLYLACACLHAVPGAVEAFDRAVLAHVPAFVHRTDPFPAFADEVRQVLREKLFVGTADARPRIADYSGRGDLRKWVRVVAVRTALNLRLQRDRQFREGQKPDLAPVLADRQEPELVHLKGQHRLAFQEAFQEALSALSSEQRNLLRLRFVDGLAIDQIAELFQIHRATVVRKLAGARKDVHEQTRRLLQERVRLNGSEFDVLARLVRSQIDVRISQILKPGGS